MIGQCLFFLRLHGHIGCDAGIHEQKSLEFVLLQVGLEARIVNASLDCSNQSIDVEKSRVCSSRDVSRETVEVEEGRYRNSIGVLQQSLYVASDFCKVASAFVRRRADDTLGSNDLGLNADIA